MKFVGGTPLIFLKSKTMSHTANSRTPRHAMAARACLVLHGRTLRVLGLALLLVLSLARTAVAAKYGEACSQTTDCQQRKAPFCSTFFTDKSYDFNEMDLYKTYSPDEYATALARVDTVHKSQGMCVECVSDCDCGVNEFCGYDFEEEKYEKDTKEWTYTYKVKIPSGITSTNKGGGMSASIKREVELFAKQYEGLPIKSKCKKYSTSHIKGPKVCNANIVLSAFAQMVEQSLLSGPSDLLSTCSFRDRFCGRIVSWGPKFHETRYMGEVSETSLIKNAEFQLSSAMSTGNSYDDAAQCVPAVVAKDSVTCPSCLYGGQCSSLRDDKRVCCTSTYDSYFDTARTCHDSTADTVSYERYTSCETACARNGNGYRASGAYYSVCKDPADGIKKTVMTDGPESNSEANTQTWCKCVEECLACTGTNGGIGERPIALTDVSGAYTSIHGTCAPPPASWETPTATTSTPAASQAASVTDSNYNCATTDPEETCAIASTSYTACKPSCVDCLVAAMQYKCDGATSSCPTTTTAMNILGSCRGPRLNRKFQRSTSFYEFDILSSPMEWEGVCQGGNCKACTNGDERCSTVNPQVCVGGEWASQDKFDQLDPALNVQTRSQIATAVMIGMCFLALLGNIAATCMIKNRQAAKTDSEMVDKAPAKGTTNQPTLLMPAPSAVGISTVEMRAPEQYLPTPIPDDANREGVMGSAMV